MSKGRALLDRKNIGQALSGLKQIQSIISNYIPGTNASRNLKKSTLWLYNFIEAL